MALKNILKAALDGTELPEVAQLDQAAGDQESATTQQVEELMEQAGIAIAAEEAAAESEVAPEVAAGAVVDNTAADQAAGST
ncbi:MAG: hypothetical protein EXQ84_06795 [Rhodospirillaceae bacterium]|nr:hypothetical protein [Rhodospirillaceae bacterium]